MVSRFVKFFNLMIFKLNHSRFKGRLIFPVSSTHTYIYSNALHKCFQNLSPSSGSFSKYQKDTNYKERGLIAYNKIGIFKNMMQRRTSQFQVKKTQKSCG
jgi:hypothetical protein